MKTINLTNTGDWQALRAAEKWCQQNGYSYGSLTMQGIGIKRGQCQIAKLRNLTPKELGELDGKITSSDFKQGPVCIHLKEQPKFKITFAHDECFSVEIQSVEYRVDKPWIISVGNQPVAIESLAPELVQLLQEAEKAARAQYNAKKADQQRHKYGRSYVKGY